MRKAILVALIFGLAGCRQAEQRQVLPAQGVVTVTRATAGGQTAGRVEARDAQGRLVYVGQ